MDKKNMTVGKLICQMLWRSRFNVFQRIEIQGLSGDKIIGRIVTKN